MTILDAILAGERDPAQLAKWRDPRIKAKPEIIQKSLVGNWQPQHLFTVKQSRRLYGEYQQQIAECDAEMERLIGGLEPRVDPQLQPLPPDSKKNRTYAKKRKQRAKTQPPSREFDLRTEVYKLFGVDVTQIPGLEFLALHVVQRDRPESVLLGHGGQFRFLAGAVPGPRYQRGPRAVARPTQGS